MPTCHIGMFKTYHVGNMFTYEENPTGINGSQGCLYAGYVDDGILAFVPNPNYVTQGYTFKGIYWGGFGNYDPATGKIHEFGCRSGTVRLPDADKSRKRPQCGNCRGCCREL